MAVLFIYMNKIGDIRVEKLEEAVILEEHESWEHIATIDPQKYLQTMLNKYPKVVADFRR